MFPPYPVSFVSSSVRSFECRLIFVTSQQTTKPARDIWATIRDVIPEITCGCKPYREQLFPQHESENSAPRLSHFDSCASLGPSHRAGLSPLHKKMPALLVRLPGPNRATLLTRPRSAGGVPKYADLPPPARPLNVMRSFVHTPLYTTRTVSIA